jgi:general secretion pathway protein I
MRRLLRRRAFSLLEVLFAVTLFGAVVTFILSAQAGLVAGNRTAANTSQAIELARCRMSELEEKQLKLGFPEIEDKDTSPICCDDKEVAGFSCDWQVERVTLPQPAALGGDAGLTSSLGGGLFGDAGTSPLSAIATGVPPGLVNPMGGAQLDLDAGLQNIGTSLTQQLGGAGGAQGLLSMVFTLVYPSLKPLLESAIRRITIVVRWKEGATPRDFTLTQYVTNPSRAGLLAGMADAGAFGDGGALPSTGTGTGTGAGGATPGSGLSPPGLVTGTGGRPL